jgi:hypothetical protein
MNKKPIVKILRVPPLVAAEQACLVLGELAELIDKGYDITKLAQHALQFVQWFDVAVSADGFTIYPQGTATAFAVVGVCSGANSDGGAL